MRILCVSPLPPARSGVADYAAALNRRLERHARVDAAETIRRLSLADYDALLYHIGNNPLHLPGYKAALEHPGITVLHDAVLHHLLLGSLSREDYIEEFVFNCGEWMRDLAADLWRDRALSAASERYFRYPMIRRLVERSRAVVVHNPGARRMVEQATKTGSESASCEKIGIAASAGETLSDSPGLRLGAAGCPSIFSQLPGTVSKVKVVEIPHLVETPPEPDPDAAAELRRRLGIPDGAVVISCFGYLRPAKRLRSLLEASRRLNVPHRLLIVGQFVCPEYEQALAAALSDSRVVRLPYVSEEEFWRLAALTDICVNLRRPSAGETSGIGLKLMALGKAVAVTRGDETSAFPEMSVVRVDAGEAEIEMLAHYLYALAADREMRDHIGGNAKRYIVERHGPEEVARRYMDLAVEP